MDTMSEQVSTRALREGLSDTVNRVAYGHERIGITRHGKLAAVIIDAEDFALLEKLEIAVDVAAYDAAKAEDDGHRVPLDELTADLGL
jgi:prevent-host-death family protein